MILRLRTGRAGVSPNHYLAEAIQDGIIDAGNVNQRRTCSRRVGPSDAGGGHRIRCSLLPGNDSGEVRLKEFDGTARVVGPVEPPGTEACGPPGVCRTATSPLPKNGSLQTSVVAETCWSGQAVAEQLVRLGVRRLLLIDPDTLTASNVTRVYGSTPGHVGRPSAAPTTTPAAATPSANCRARR